VTATLNPSDKSTDIALSNGNLTATYTDDSNNGAVRATVSFSSGKWYYEWQPGGTTAVNCNAGWASASEALNNISKTTKSVNADPNFNNVNFNNTNLGSWENAFASGDWCGVAIDIGNALIWYICESASNFDPHQTVASH
jgi:hypothetical protein